MSGRKTLSAAADAREERWVPDRGEFLPWMYLGPSAKQLAEKRGRSPEGPLPRQTESRPCRTRPYQPWRTAYRAPGGLLWAARQGAVKNKPARSRPPGPPSQTRRRGRRGPAGGPRGSEKFLEMDFNHL